ncbi:hypothetical protein BGY98DRAFT_1099858 [Russula aff. rugulosa BPL654]|nr:hypothetical protein BGY98DRAFT_1099858 [Russula aff. rugulosa BPL654]
MINEPSVPWSKTSPQAFNLSTTLGSPLSIILESPPSRCHIGSQLCTSPNSQEDFNATSMPTINVLPDVALLEIFAFVVDDNDSIDAWHPLVHVCQKWRNIVFGSPRRLNLQLHCTAGRPVREMLDIWPPLPIIISGSYCPSSSVDNIVAALKPNDRVRDVMFRHTSSYQCENVLAAMLVPFPELTRLHFESKDKTVPVIPDSFLGGSAPRLRSLSLDGILFSGLSKLLLSATDLVDLSLSNIPHSGYMTPHAMATCLSTLTRLKSLSLNFQSPKSRPDPGSRCYPPAARSVLRALTELRFTGVSEYLEDLVARIDAPLLHVLDIRFFFQLIFDTPQLAQFIDRTPQLKAHDDAWVVFSDSGATVSLPRAIGDRCLELGISCRQIDWQLSSLVQVCGSCFSRALISSVDHLHILEKRFSSHHREDDIESNQWLELFLPFTTVRHLYLSKGFAPRVMLALQEFVGDRAMGLLPALQYLHLEVPPIWTSPAGDWGVRSCAAATQTPENRSSMGQARKYLPTSSTVAQLSCLHHPATTAESCDIGRLPTDTPPDDHALPMPHRQTSFAQYPATNATSGCCDAGPLTIHVLPYDVLLGIFGYYLSWKGSAWPSLVHVCQRWRNFVLGSVRHLKLEIYCTGGKPVRKMLDIWPPLPIILHHINPPSWDVDNIVAALECNDRVRDIDLTGIARPQLQTILAAMQVSFPVLTHLALMSDLLSTVVPVVSNSFLGGSAPRLRSLVLGRIPFPGLPNLLLSTTNLVDLALYHVPNSGPISLEAMATCLSRLTRLNSLSLDFQSTQLFPDRERRRPPRFVLPALTRFSFRGVRGYLEDLVSRIDAPLLDWMLSSTMNPCSTLRDSPSS